MQAPAPIPVIAEVALERHSRIQPAREAWLSALVVFIAFTVSVAWIWRVSIADQSERVIDDVARIAAATTGLVDPDVYTALLPGAGSDQELHSAETRRLANMQGSQSPLAGLYALSPHGAGWRIVLDAQHRTRFGDRVVPAAAREAFTTRQTRRSEEYASELGRIVSVFSPIVNADGDVIGVVGADILAEDVRSAGGQADRVLLYGMVLTLTFAIGMGALVYRMRSTLRDVMGAQDSRMVALERNAEALSRAQEHSGSVLASMSHEVRTPLTAILGFTELLLEPNENVAVIRGHAQTIRRNGHHLLDVLNDALDISKIDAGMMRVHPRPFDPRRLLREVTDLFEPRAKEKLVTLRCIDTGSIPECVDSDEFRVRQILLNLLSNGLKFTEKGSVTVSVGYDTATATLEYRVTDTGVGIAEDQLDQIFKPYRQALNDDVRRFGGTGLGLAISKRLAALLHGELDVQSRLAGGSTFTLKVPAPVAAVASVRATRELVSPHDNWKPRPSWRVLVVEDTLEHQKLLFAILRRAGHSVDVCETGERALKLVRESEYLREPYTILVLDAHLPGMSGSATARAVREHGFRGPILALTADESDETREACLLAGCDEVVLKPVDGEKLLTLLSRLVHGAKTLGVA